MDLDDYIEFDLISDSEWTHLVSPYFPFSLLIFNVLNYMLSLLWNDYTLRFLVVCNIFCEESMR